MKIKLTLFTNYDKYDEQEFHIETPVVPRKGEIVWVTSNNTTIPEEGAEENKHFSNPFVVDRVDYTFDNNKLFDIMISAHIQRDE